MTHESFYCLILESMILLQHFFLLFPPSKSSAIPLPLFIKLWPRFFSLIIIYGRNSWPKVVWEDWSDICQEKLMSTMWWISEELTLVLSWDANRSWMKRPRQKRKDIWVRIFQCQGLRENFHVCLFFFLAYLLFFVSSLISNRNIYVPCVKSASFGAFSFTYFC